MTDRQKWPDVVWIVRHGESAGNVARRNAEAAGLPLVDRLAARDVDVPLSPLGERQARALGDWFASLPVGGRPSAVLSSPYLRARTTASLILERASLGIDPLDVVVDERLREREFGILDRLTRVGVELKFPEQAELKEALGKFYHRPPGGESWCDVILRLRNVLDSLQRDYRRERVVIVCHSVVVLCFRYLFENLSETEILSVDAAQRVPNCSVTSFEYDPTIGRHGHPRLRLFNFVAPLEETGTEVTTAKDAPVAPK